MKIRTDFVTNSSSSSFIACGVYSEELADFVVELLGGKTHAYSRYQVGALEVFDDVVSVTTTLDFGNFYVFRNMDDWDRRTEKQQEADALEANTPENIADAFSPFLPFLSSEQRKQLECLIEDAIDRGNTQAMVYMDQTDGFECQTFNFRGHGQKDPYAKIAEQQWLANSGDLITKEPLIYFPDSLFVFSGFGWSDDGRSDWRVEEVIKRGGIFRGKVSGQTNYLVIDPAYAGESKIKAVKDLRQKGIFIDVILIEDLEKALKEERSEAREAEIKEKVLRKRELEAEARRIKKEEEGRIRYQERLKKEEMRRQMQQEARLAAKQEREAQKVEEKAKLDAYFAQALSKLKAQCESTGKKYPTFREIFAEIRFAGLAVVDLERYIREQYQQNIEYYFIQNQIMMTEQERLRVQLDEVIDVLATRYAAAQKKAVSVAAVWEENPDIDKRLIMEKSVFCTGKTPRVLLVERGIVYRDGELATQQSNAAQPRDPNRIPEGIRKRMDTLFAKLDEAYPDKVIVRLSKDHKKWGETVTELYRLLDYPDYKTFLEAYGYQVNTEDKGGRPKKDPMEIINELKRRYPNGPEFTTVDELKAANPDLASRFQSLRNKSNEYFGMPFTQYLRSIGLIK